MVMDQNNSAAFQKLVLVLGYSMVEPATRNLAEEFAAAPTKSFDYVTRMLPRTMVIEMPDLILLLITGVV